MHKNPEISVITAVYNGEEHLGQCLESIRAQTFTDYEHIIVNDASTDGTEEILAAWQKEDPRIRIINNKTNLGRAVSRNRALTAARGSLAAILDADDYSLPDRLASQLSFMKENPEVQVLGGDIQIHGTNEILRHPRTDAEIRADLFFDSSLFHSTVMMRKSILTSTRNFYDAGLPLSQDYGLWASLMFFPQTVFANMAKPLSVYRLPDKPRPGYAEKQFNYANVVRGRILKQAGLENNKQNLACHLALLYGNAAALGLSPADCVAWGKKLSAANARMRLAPPEALESQISQRLARVMETDIMQRQKNASGGSGKL